MNKRIAKHIGYWSLILVVLTGYFGFQWGNYTLAFFFACMLLPIVAGTSYIFNLYLVPQFFLKGKYGQFSLYLFYLLIGSLYFEMLVALLSFVILAQYRVDVIDLRSINIFVLGAYLYLIVLATGFIRMALELKRKSQLVGKLVEEKKEHAPVIIRADRKNQQIAPADILYLESLSDYVKVVTVDGELITREKISKLHERLPELFVRIHRSFVVNKERVDSYNATEVVIGGQTFPISRTYKKVAGEAFGSQPN